MDNSLELIPQTLITISVTFIDKKNIIQSKIRLMKNGARCGMFTYVRYPVPRIRYMYRRTAATIGEITFSADGKIHAHVKCMSYTAGSHLQFLNKKIQTLSCNFGIITCNKMVVLRTIDNIRDITRGGQVRKRRMSAPPVL